MRIDGLTAIWESSLPPTDRLVLLAVASHINNQSSQAWPSLDRLASMTGLNRVTVHRRVRALVAAGVITVRRRFGSSSVYAIATIPQKLHCATIDSGQSLTDATIDPEQTSVVAQSEHQKLHSAYIKSCTVRTEPLKEPSKGIIKENHPASPPRPEPTANDLDLFGNQPKAKVNPLAHFATLKSMGMFIPRSDRDPEGDRDALVALIELNGPDIVAKAAQSLHAQNIPRWYLSHLQEEIAALRAQERLTEPPPERYVDPIIAQALSILDTMGYAKASSVYAHGQPTEDRFREMLEYNQGAAMEFIAAAEGVTA